MQDTILNHFDIHTIGQIIECELSLGRTKWKGYQIHWGKYIPNSGEIVSMLNSLHDHRDLTCFPH